MKKKSLNRPFLKKFLFSYFIIFSIPFLLNIITFKASTNILKDYVDKSNSAKVTQIRYTLDQKLSFLENLVFQISQNKKIDSLSKELTPVDSYFHLDLLSAIKEISPFMMLENSIAEDYYIIFLNSKYVIDGTTIIPFDVFFNYKYTYGDWNQNDWINFLEESYHSYSFLTSDNITSGTETFKGIPFVKNIPFYFNKDNSAFILFNIKESDLFSNFSFEDNSIKGFPNLLNKDHKIIAGEDFNRSSGDHITIDAISEKFDLIYQLNVPYKDIYEKLLFIRTIMILLNIVIFILGSAAAIFFARLNANPLYSIYNLIKTNVPASENNTPGFDYLNSSINQMINNNKSLESVLKDHKKVISDEFYYKLIKYGFDSPVELAAMYKYLEKPIRDGLYGIILFNIPSTEFTDETLVYSEVLEMKVALIETFKQICSYPDRVLDIDTFSIGYIYNIDNFNEESWFNGVTKEIKILEESISELSMPYFWTIGNPVEDTYDLNNSYREAKIVADDIKDYTVDHVFQYRNHSSVINEYSLPIETIQKLINLTNSGEIDKAKDIFTKNWEDNMTKNNLSQRSKQIYFLELRSFLVRISSSITESADFLNFHLKPIDEIKKMILDSINEVGHSVLSNQENSSPELKEKLFNYLKNNYKDKNLSLSSIAIDFNKSESYISHFFKKYCNINFYTQLEKLRMEKSCELLKDNDVSIQEISDEVGYSSMHSFRRAFKKVYGISPSSYRKLLMNNKNP